MSIEKYITELYLGTEGMIVTLTDDSKHPLSDDPMSKYLIEKYIKENIDSEYLDTTDIHKTMKRLFQIAKNLITDMSLDENWRKYSFHDYKEWDEELKEIEKVFKLTL